MQKREVKAGEIVRVDIDMVIGNDITIQSQLEHLRRSGAETLAKPDNFCIVMDHYIPAKGYCKCKPSKDFKRFAYKTI